MFRRVIQKTAKRRVAVKRIVKLKVVAVKKRAHDLQRQRYVQHFYMCVCDMSATITSGTHSCVFVVDGESARFKG